MFKNLIKDEKGQSSLEYGLIIGVVVVGLIMALGAFGTQLSDMLMQINTKIVTIFANAN